MNLDISFCSLHFIQVGLELERSFGGEAAALVKSCGNSAVCLVALIARHFPGILSSYFFVYLLLAVTILISIWMIEVLEVVFVKTCLHAGVDAPLLSRNALYIFYQTVKA